MVATLRGRRLFGVPVRGLFLFIGFAVLVLGLCFFGALFIFGLFLVAFGVASGHGQRRSAADLHRRRGAEVGPRRHRRDVAGVEDVGPGAGGAGAARRDVSDDGDGRGDDVLDDLSHRGGKPAGRVHVQEDDGGVALPRLGEAALDIVGGGGTDGALDFELDDRTRPVGFGADDGVRLGPRSRLGVAKVRRKDGQDHDKGS